MAFKVLPEGIFALQVVCAETSVRLFSFFPPFSIARYGELNGFTCQSMVCHTKKNMRLIMFAQFTFIAL